MILTATCYTCGFNIVKTYSQTLHVQVIHAYQEFTCMTQCSMLNCILWSEVITIYICRYYIKQMRKKRKLKMLLLLFLPLFHKTSSAYLSSYKTLMSSMNRSQCPMHQMSFPCTFRETSNPAPTK